MKKGFFLISILIFSILLLPLLNSQPVFQTNTNTDQGYQIFHPEFEIVPEGASFNLHLHVSNISSGKLLENTEVDCFLHLYDSSGNHTFESGIMGKDPNLWDHEIFIDSGNFTEGTHAFFIGCNTTSFGGEARGTFEVTGTGRAAPTSGEGMIYLSSLAVMFFLSLLFLSLGALTNGPVRFGFIGASFINALISLFYAQAALSEAFSGFTRISFVYEVVFFWVSLLLMLLIIIFVLVAVIFQAVDQWRTKKGKNPNRDPN